MQEGTGQAQDDKTKMSVIEQWMQAIAKEEGFGPPQNRPTRNHNPGDLKSPQGTPHFWLGQTGLDPQGFAVFQDDMSGWAALRSDLLAHSRHNPAQTLAQFMAQYAPAQDHNDPAHYAELCATAMGVQPDTTLSDILAMDWSA